MINKEETEKKDIMSKEKEIELATLLIKNNIDKLPSFHINNLHNNNIHWNNTKIRNLVYKIKEETYPSNKIFLNYIHYAKVNLGDVESESNSFYICPRQLIFNNFQNKENEYLIYLTTLSKLIYLKKHQYYLLTERLGVVQKVSIRL